MDKNKKLFPQRLWELIHDEKYNFCLRWSSDGQRVYLNRNEFEAHYLKTSDNQFHTQKAISFVRQMNMYGFRKVDDCYYENDNFKRNCHHLLKNMVRRHSNKSFFSSMNVESQNNNHLGNQQQHHHHHHHHHRHHQQQRHHQTSQYAQNQLYSTTTPTTFTPTTTSSIATTTTALASTNQQQQQQHDNQRRHNLALQSLYNQKQQLVAMDQLASSTSQQVLGTSSTSAALGASLSFKDLSGSIGDIGAAIAAINSNPNTSPLASTLYHRLAALNFTGAAGQAALQYNSSTNDQSSAQQATKLTTCNPILQQDPQQKSSLTLEQPNNYDEILQQQQQQQDVGTVAATLEQQVLQQTLLNSIFQLKQQQQQSPMSLQESLLINLHQQNPNLLLESLAANFSQQTTNQATAALAAAAVAAAAANQQLVGVSTGAASSGSSSSSPGAEIGLAGTGRAPVAGQQSNSSSSFLPLELVVNRPTLPSSTSENFSNDNDILDDIQPGSQTQEQNSSHSSNSNSSANSISTSSPQLLRSYKDTNKSLLNLTKRNYNCKRVSNHLTIRAKQPIPHQHHLQRGNLNLHQIHHASDTTINTAHLNVTEQKQENTLDIVAGDGEQQDDDVIDNDIVDGIVENTEDNNNVSNLEFEDELFNQDAKSLAVNNSSSSINTRTLVSHHHRSSSSSSVASTTSEIDNNNMDTIVLNLVKSSRSSSAAYGAHVSPPS